MVIKNKLINKNGRWKHFCGLLGTGAESVCENEYMSFPVCTEDITSPEHHHTFTAKPRTFDELKFLVKTTEEKAILVENTIHLKKVLLGHTSYS